MSDQLIDKPTTSLEELFEQARGEGTQSGNDSARKAARKTSAKRAGNRTTGVQGKTEFISNCQWDFVLLGLTITTILFGIVMMTSASISIADRQSGEPFFYLWRQLTALALGALMALLVINTPLKVWQQAGPYLLMMGIALLVLVLIPGIGREVNGSARWIPFGVFNLQVSELVKLAMVIYLAGYLVRRNESVRETTKGFIIPMMVLAVIGVLLLLEPDLGAAFVISATAMGMLFIGGVKLFQFLLLMLMMAGSLALLIVFEPYRFTRFKSFMDPWADPFSSGFQLTQSLIAFGRGDWLGEGLGSSIQKLFYLPEAHTDFLFAVIAEELGVIGSVAVIVLFALLIGRIFYIASRANLAQKAFSSYLCYGLGMWIGLQVLVNMGVNMGLLPTKGLTLPMMSYGGSSLMVMCVVMALVLRADHEIRIQNLSNVKKPSKRAASRGSRSANKTIGAGA